jgi:hypothetical protein
MSFLTRIKLAFSILFGADVPASTPQTPALPSPVSTELPVAPKPILVEHASALFVLALFQREGRLIDFLREDITGASDADIGAAARLVHEQCGKVLKQYLPTSPISSQSEGEKMKLESNFDSNRFRLVGHVTGTGPWTGTIKHAGIIASAVNFPSVPTSINLNVIAPCEVEVSVS